MGHPPDEAVPRDDELGIFIDSEGNYRVLVPNNWSRTDGTMPQFAYMVVAALVRLSRRSEVEFTLGLAEWAKTDLERDRNLDLPSATRPRKPTSRH